MLKLNSPQARTESARSVKGANGKRAYAIGDVHGCFELLLKIIKKIQDHNETRLERELHIILLGDLIDRGPQSREVVDFLLNDRPRQGTYHFIKGNHEEVLVRILDGDVSRLNMWLAHGGWQTIQSYGGSSRAFRNLSGADALNLLREIIPTSHIEFLRSLDDGIQFGDYFFTHAGIRPGVPISEQSGRDLRWIREGFLDTDADFGSVVVHGHTISKEVTIRANRIGVDTGAYLSGTLSAFWIDECETGVISVNDSITQPDR